MRSKVRYYLLMCVAISCLFSATTASTIVAAEAQDVLTAAGTVLADWHMPIIEHNETEIVTEKVEIGIDEIADYIIENQPDTVPGWTKARVWFHITAKEHSSITEVGIVAFIERYGTRSALMLIPPSWIAVPSSGNLEQELIADIERVLSTTEGGAR